MAIKTIVENLDGVPEGLHEFYKESDDGFVLEVEGIEGHPDVVNLRNAYQAAKSEQRDARQQIQELKKRSENIPEDFDPELWQKAKSGELTEGLVSVRKELEGKVSDLEGKLSERDGLIRTMTVDRELGAALDAANITNPTFRKAATHMLRDAVKLDGDKVVVDSDMGPLTASEYVKKWAASEEGKAFVSQPSGGGSKSGDTTVKGGPKSWDEAKTPKEKVAYLKSQNQ